MTELVPILGFVGLWVVLLVVTMRINRWFWASYRSMLAADSAPDRLAIYFLCGRMLFQPKTAWRTVADKELAATMKECGERWPKKLPPFLYALTIMLLGGFIVMFATFLSDVVRVYAVGP